MGLRRISIVILLLGSLCSRCLGVIVSFVDSPPDDLAALGGCNYLQNRPELKSLSAEYNELIQVRFRPMNLTNIIRVFGAQLDRAPTNRARPLFAPVMIGESGLHNPESNYRHCEYYAIGNIGYLDFHSGFDGVSLGACVIYFRTDDKFVPLKSTNDIPAREKWDEAKFDALEAWLDEHMPKQTNAGAIQLYESRSSRVHLKISLGVRDAKLLNITSTSWPLAFRIENTGKYPIKADVIPDLFFKGFIHVLSEDGKEQQHDIQRFWFTAVNDVQPGGMVEHPVVGDLLTFFPSMKDGVYQAWWTLADSKSNVLRFAVKNGKVQLVKPAG